MKRFVLILLALGIFGSVGVACQEKGPFEQAGEEIDETVNDAKREVEDATD